MSLIKTRSGGYFRTPGPQFRRLPLDVVAYPAIAGTAVAGATLSAVPGEYNFPVVSRAYTWTVYNAETVVIATAAGPSYVIPALDPGSTIGMTEAFLDLAGRVLFETSEVALVALSGAPAFTTAPTIAGTGVVGSPLTATDATAAGNPTPTISRAWLRNAVPISGATAASYTPVEADATTGITFQNRAVSIAGEASSDVSNAITVTSGSTTLPFPTYAASAWGCTERTQLTPEGFLRITFGPTVAATGFAYYPITRSDLVIPDNLTSLPQIAPNGFIDRPKSIGTLVRPRMYARRQSDGAVQLLSAQPDFTMVGIPASPPPTEYGNVVTMSSTATMTDIRNEWLNTPRTAAKKQIRLRGKNYSGNIRYESSTNLYWNNGVTIVSDDPENPAVFKDNGFRFYRLHGFTLNGITFDSDSVYAASSPYAGYPSGTLTDIQRCSDVKLLNLRFKGGHIHNEMRHMKRVEVGYTEHSGCGMDVFRHYLDLEDYRVHHTLISGFDIATKYEVKDATGGGTRHPDCLQWAVTTGSIVYPRRLTVESNWWECLVGSACHGLFAGNPLVGSNTGSLFEQWAYRDVTIRNNFIRTPATSGIGWLCFDRATIAGNLMRSVPGRPMTGNGQPQVRLYDVKSRDIVITNNVSPLNLPGGPGVSVTPANGYTASGNVVSATAVPSGWQPLVPSGAGKNVGQWGGGYYN